MGSYIPGELKNTRDKIQIRGYYGDIVVSPYIQFGIETDSKPENEYFYTV